MQNYFVVGSFCIFCEEWFLARLALFLLYFLSVWDEINVDFTLWGFSFNNALVYSGCTKGGTKMLKKFKMFGILLAVVLVAVACSGKDASPTSSSDSKKEASTVTEGMTGEIAVISREEGSGTRGAFVELVGVQKDKNDITTPEAIVQNNTEAVMTTVAGEKNAIGYISLGSLNDTVKVLKVDEVEATAKNVANASYKIARPFNIATKEEPKGVVLDFIQFILGDEGQAIAENKGYVKSPEKAAYTPGKDLKGEIAIAGSSSVTPLMEKLAEAYMEKNPDVKIQVNLSDSTTGMQSVKDGIADIGMASRDLKDSEKDLHKKVIAMDGIAVVVNKSNSMSSISMDVLKNIYLGKITDWKDVK